MFIRAKLRGITRNDVIDFARDNGIRRPDSIIRDVVASLKKFRSVALKYGVTREWTGRVEASIISHLTAWGEWEKEKQLPILKINGHTVKNIHLEETYKRNYHLYADIDGDERKFVVSKNKDEFSLIKTAGLSNITDERLKAMVCKYFKL